MLQVGARAGSATAACPSLELELPQQVPHVPIHLPTPQQLPHALGQIQPTRSPMVWNWLKTQGEFDTCGHLPFIYLLHPMAAFP